MFVIYFVVYCAHAHTLKILWPGQGDVPRVIGTKASAEKNTISQNETKNYSN